MSLRRTLRLLLLVATATAGTAHADIRVGKVRPQPPCDVASACRGAEVCVQTGLGRPLAEMQAAGWSLRCRAGATAVVCMARDRFDLPRVPAPQRALLEGFLTAPPDGLQQAAATGSVRVCGDGAREWTDATARSTDMRGLLEGNLGATDLTVLVQVTASAVDQRIPSDEGGAGYVVQRIEGKVLTVWAGDLKPGSAIAYQRFVEAPGKLPAAGDRRIASLERGEAGTWRVPDVAYEFAYSAEMEKVLGELTAPGPVTPKPTTPKR